MHIKWLSKITKLIIMLLLVSVSSQAKFMKQKILTPEEAFKVTAHQTNSGVDIKIKLGEKMYAYDDKLHVELLSPQKVLLDKESIRPKPVKFHDFIVHRKDIEIKIPANIIEKYLKNGKYKIKVSYQGCSEVGLCYSPMSNTYDFTLKSDTFKKVPIAETKSITSGLSQEDNIANSIKNSSFLMVLLTFFGFGLLLALTPCVFPMIPILSSIIISQSKNMNTKRAFFLSLVYVLAMSLAYTMAGILAALFGANIQTALQNPWVISVFSFIFVLLSLSMFGFYEIQMPSFIQTKLSKKSENSQNSGVLGVAIMGFLSALIVGPCVAAPLAGALIYIGQSGDALLGGSALFVMSLGMGVPLLIVGAGAGRFMPKPGVWMDNIKAIFGVLMLAVAIYMLSRIVSGQISMLLWMALILISSVYMGALEPIREKKSGWSKLVKGFGIIFFIYSVFLFVGAMRGVTNPLNPLQTKEIASVVNVQTKQVITKHAVFKTVKTLDELNKIIKNSKKIVMIDFYADWCISCKELDENTFKNPTVRAKMDRFNLIRIDVTKNDLEDKKLLKRFSVFGPPAMIFFKNGIELKSLKVVGYKDAKEFSSHLDKVIEK